MGDIWSSLLLFILLCGSAGIGFFANSRLPERHRSKESMEVVQLANTLLVTFIAIVLGLLTTSVKSGYDLAYNARGDYAAQITQLDRCLRDYGPDTAPIREQLKSYVATIIARTWPSEPPPVGVSYPDISQMARIGENPILVEMINEVGRETRLLQPTDPLHRNLLAACTEQFGDVIKSRWKVIEGLRPSISAPFYWVLVFWLVILFASFGLRAPPNPMIVSIIGLCALSVTSAVFVILDMDRAYGGLFGIPSTAMRNALADMMR